MGEVIDTFSIEVLNDTVMSNSVKYFELSQGFGLGKFVRADSDYIYFYDESDSSDEAVFNLKAETEIWYNTGLFGSENDSSRVQLDQISDEKIFGIETRNLTFTFDYLYMLTTTFSNKFGPLYFSWLEIEQSNARIIGCKIARKSLWIDAGRSGFLSLERRRLF